jgi:hypothetical protein
VGWSTTTSRGAVADRALVQCREKVRRYVAIKYFCRAGGSRAGSDRAVGGEREEMLTVVGAGPAALTAKMLRPVAAAAPARGRCRGRPAGGSAGPGACSREPGGEARCRFGGGRRARSGSPAGWVTLAGTWQQGDDRGRGRVRLREQKATRLGVACAAASASASAGPWIARGPVPAGVRRSWPPDRACKHKVASLLC